MSEVIEARNIKLNVDASDWRDSMVKSGQLLVDSDYITKDYIDLSPFLLFWFKFIDRFGNFLS